MSGELDLEYLVMVGLVALQKEEKDMLSGPRTALQEWAGGLYRKSHVWSEEGKLFLKVEGVNLSELTRDFYAAKWHLPARVILISECKLAVPPHA